MRTLLFLLTGLLATGIVVFLVFSERPGNVSEPKGVSALPLDYARNFSVDSVAGHRILTVRGGMRQFRWVLVDSASAGDASAKLPGALDSLPRLVVPVRRVAILSTTYLGYLERLGITDKVVALGDRKYIADSSFYFRCDSLSIPSVGSGPSLSVEALYAAHPDLVLAFSTGTDVNDAFPRLASVHLPVVFTTEWLEDSPLAKAEWLKFFGVLFGCEKRADSLFSLSVRQYLDLRARIASFEGPGPTVFTGVPQGGVWFASGGRSYMASLIKDAGGVYLWNRDTSTGSCSMSLERALMDARKAEVWLNPGGWRSRAEGLAAEGRVVLVEAWKENRVYQYDARKGAAGGLDFYEGAVVYPEMLLRDLASLLHPGVFHRGGFMWYRRLL